MITNQFRVAVSLLALAVMACFPVSAGQVVLRKAEPTPSRMRRIHTLAASATYTIVPGGSIQRVRLFVYNNSGVTFLAGLEVYWSVTGNPRTSQTKTGSFALEEILSPGQTVSHYLTVPTTLLPPARRTEPCFSTQPCNLPSSAVKAWIP
jgi:hypothetical protein